MKKLITLVTALLVASLMPLLAAPKADATIQGECYFTKTEFLDWMAVADMDSGWTLAQVQNYVNCDGLWRDGGAKAGEWNGYREQLRWWPRPDGGVTEMVFADNGVWHVHDWAETTNKNVGGTNDYLICQFPRNGNGPCNEVWVG